MNLPIERVMQYFAGVDWGAVGAGVLRVVLVLVIARVLIAALRPHLTIFAAPIRTKSSGPEADAHGRGRRRAGSRTPHESSATVSATRFS